MTMSGPCQPAASQQTEFLWMSLPEVSPARISAGRARVQVYAADRGPVCGPKSPDLLAKFDPAGWSWKTSSTCLLQGEISTLYSARWPRSGIMRSGIAYRLPPLVRLISGTGCGSSRGQERLIPTPVATDAEKMTLPPSEADRGGLVGWILREGLPTPLARDADKVTLPPAEFSSRTLPGRLMRAGISGRLNPEFYRWLMGYPAGHARLEPTEIPLSRKSRKSSGEQSCKSSKTREPGGGCE